MTVVRRIVKGGTYFLTRRVLERRYGLQCTKRANDTFEYCLARAAETHGVQVVAYIAMHTHYHAIIHDPGGVAPEFYRDFHATMAKCLNAQQRRWECFWSGHGTSLVRLTTAEDILKFGVYLQVNAVRAGAVRTWSEWPGARSSTDGCRRRAKRCKRVGKYFDRAKNAEEIELPLHAPPEFQELGGADAWVARLREGVAKEEGKVSAELAAKQHRYPSIEQLRCTATTKHSTSYEERRRRKPQIACRDRATRLALLEELTLFRRAYAAARELWLEGRPGDVEFPYGTYQLRNYPRVRVAEGP